jgi:hypothetical protein
MELQFEDPVKAQLTFGPCLSTLRSLIHYSDGSYTRSGILDEPNGGHVSYILTHPSKYLWMQTTLDNGNKPDHVNMKNLPSSTSVSNSTRRQDTQLEDYCKQSWPFCVATLTGTYSVKNPAVYVLLMLTAPGDGLTYLILLSRFAKKRPRMLMASTRRPPMASIDMIVFTHSYKIALPAFLLPSVFVATCPRNNGQSWSTMVEK